MKSAALVLGCGLLGGAVGFIGFQWLTSQGFYALVLPGGLLGLAAGLPRNRSLVVAIACGILALLLGLFAEWRFAPFKVDPSLGYFLTHVHQLRPLTMLMTAVGAAMGFWVPFRRIGDAAQATAGRR